MRLSKFFSTSVQSVLIIFRANFGCRKCKNRIFFSLLSGFSKMSSHGPLSAVYVVGWVPFFVQGYTLHFLIYFIIQHIKPLSLPNLRKVIFESSQNTMKLATNFWGSDITDFDNRIVIFIKIECSTFFSISIKNFSGNFELIKNQTWLISIKYCEDLYLN